MANVAFAQALNKLDSGGRTPLDLAVQATYSPLTREDASMTVVYLREQGGLPGVAVRATVQEPTRELSFQEQAAALGDKIRAAGDVPASGRVQPSTTTSRGWTIGA